MVDINKSILNKNNFRLLIDKVPTVEYYVQGVNIPGVSFDEVVQPAGVGVDGYFPGDKVSFDTLNVTFLVDEDLENYKEMYDWMSEIVPIANSDKYGELTGSTKNTLSVANQSGDALKAQSMITLVTNTNKNLPNRYFRFYDAFPIALGGLELLSGSETEPVTCEVQFRFTFYDIKTSS
tara:strand:+ start:8059 stop:8595 length:537 start_codon:yes stop_codon:yes gene_type:complete